MTTVEQRRDYAKAYRNSEKGRAVRSAYNQREDRRADSRNRVLARKRMALARLQEIKLESGCVDCGYKENPTALEFDHVRGEKTFTISKNPSLAWERIEEEIAKCEVRCANCHRIRTFPLQVI